MNNILFILSSPRGWQSHSHQIAHRIVDELKVRHPAAKVVAYYVAHHEKQSALAFVLAIAI